MTTELGTGYIYLYCVSYFCFSYSLTKLVYIWVYLYHTRFVLRAHKVRGTWYVGVGVYVCVCVYILYCSHCFVIFVWSH